MQIIFIQIVFAQNIDEQELFALIREHERFRINKTDVICWNNVEILFSMEYEGSNVPPADMLFLSNSIMVLKSNFYSENYRRKENRFYKYSLENNRLKIIFIDSRIDISINLEYAIDQLNRNRGILSVDEAEQSITYDLSWNRILFGGFYFFLD